MAQPPGIETVARPQRATSGPSTRLDARIVFTRSYGASGSVIVPRFDVMGTIRFFGQPRADIRKQLFHGANVANTGDPVQRNRLFGQK